MTRAIPPIVAEWARYFGDHKMVSAGVVFVHLSGILLGGGLAIAADRTALQLAPQADDVQREVTRLASVHRLIVGALTVTVASGLLMLLADLPTYLPSVLYWTKMGMVALLLANGAVRLGAERALLRGQMGHWRTFRLTSVVSLVLWFSIVLAGSFLSTLS